jgi:uncharacterized membrane protein
MKGRPNIMLTTTAWIALCIVAAIAAVFLYTTIDSPWALENGMTIVMTIIFFIAASIAVVSGFNAATGNKHATGHE